jgi:D-alanyl-lipoteichoic acid acyltransferase DltB (MBOAT superfamily)
VLFNSFVFVVFFLVVYGAYLSFRRSAKTQNLLLLLASYVFYGYWDWRFLTLIWISTFVDFFVGRALGSDSSEEQTPRRRKSLLLLSVATNLSLLGFFKYFNFFADSFADVLSLIGLQADPVTLRIVLPVGISFYTFQTMSYTIDIYRGRMSPARSFLDFATFVAFFPQLVAGPIERATNLVPQFERARQITTKMVDSGLFLIIWGYLKKIVIADNAAIIANTVFNGYTSYEGADIVVGVFAFAFQIYGDFSGYSDIARGLARLMGFELMVNFRLPYFAKSPSDFWLRWHISLSSWLRDYLYIPLGGNRKGPVGTYRNLLLTMLLGGLWHGAAWNFVIWGAFHGGILILYRLLGSSREPKPRPRLVAGLVSGIQMSTMFFLTLVGWLLFRATSADQIGYMFTHASLVPSSETLGFTLELLFYAAPLVLVQIIQYRSDDLLILTRLPARLRIPLYAFMVAWIALFSVTHAAEFIYFQF